MILGTLLRYTSLKGKKKFKELFSQGKFYGGSDISLKVFFAETASSGGIESQWALCVPRKLGGAVMRNRYRRVCKESLRALALKTKPGTHVALFPQKTFAKLSFKQRTDCLLSLLRRAKLISYYA